MPDFTMQGLKTQAGKQPVVGHEQPEPPNAVKLQRGLLQPVPQLQTLIPVLWCFATRRTPRAPLTYAGLADEWDADQDWNSPEWTEEAVQTITAEQAPHFGPKAGEKTQIAQSPQSVGCGERTSKKRISTQDWSRPAQSRNSASKPGQLTLGWTKRYKNIRLKMKGDSKLRVYVCA